MDDARIRQLAEEVLSKLAVPADPVAGDLEARVAALEAAMRELRAERGGAAPGAPAVVVTQTQVGIHAHPHPSLQVLGVAGGGERCILEPDKPCVHSGQCRAFGH